MASASSHVYETVTATFSCEDHTFTAKGKTVLSSGWKEIERFFLMSVKEKQEKENEKELPAFQAIYLNICSLLPLNSLNILTPLREKYLNAKF